MSEQDYDDGPTPAAGAAKHRRTIPKRPRRSPWKGWKWWRWAKFEAAVDRTVAAVRNGPALREAVNKHYSRVNALFARVDAAADRRESWIEATEFESERRLNRLIKLSRKHYQIIRAITRKADYILIRMLKRATLAGEYR